MPNRLLTSCSLILFGIVLFACASTNATPVPPSALPLPTSGTTSTAEMTHGPLVGGVTSDSAQVWVRTNTAARVKIQIANAADTANTKFSRELESDADSDFTLNVPLEQLSPATSYSFKVWVNGLEQAQGGAFKTFPAAATAARFKMVVLTDFAYNGALPVRTFEQAANENPDLVFIGGDFDHRDPRLLQDKRQMFQDLYSDNAQSPVAGFAKFILHRFPLAHHWDDHDYGGDNSDRTLPGRETARQVFQEYFPSYPLGKYGVYQSFPYGKDVQVFVLDGRSQRDPNLAANDDQKSMLNGERYADGQLQWLLDGLKNSTATWKLVMSPSAMNKTLLKGDSWANFTHERDQILSFIRDNKIGGVVVIAGDLHGGALDDGSNAGIPSVLVPAVNLPSCFSVPKAKLGDWSNGIYGDASHDSNFVPCPGYGVISLEGSKARVEIKDADGNLKLQMELEPSASYRFKTE